MADTSSNRDRRPVFDDAFALVLAGVRDGTLRDDTPYDVLALCERFDVRPAVLGGALQRLADIGLAHVTPGDVVRFTRLDPVAWAEGTRLLVGLVEVSMRALVPVATDDDVRRYEELVAAARRAAAERGDELDTTVLATIDFWAERTPEGFTARLLVRTMQQMRYGLATRPPWQDPDDEAWLASSLQALRLRDTGSAERAAHVFARLWERYLTSSAAVLGTDLRQTAGHASDDLYWADWRPDADWFELLGSIRDESLVRGQEYPLRALTARFRVPLQRLLPMIRRLEVMGLVEAGPDREGSVLVSTPTVDDWAETISLLLGLQEMCARSSIPVLTDGDVDELTALIARARREARVRDYAYTTTLLELNRFFALRSPNRAMRQTTTVVIARLAYILPEPPPFRQWAVEDFLQLLEEAVTSRDPDIASDACHALAAHFDAHVVDVRTRYGSMES
ncbi:DNA-binding GntR family transcriptional regulator [Curtobacterium sp. PhB130]|uniref:FCD domain-containing protein n=1 Tax=Curtobacterium sp. PhB130 TaxID=2485178 RepID=UPI000F4D0090|nr:FCD domain-containing protein [Curtobacterium sp. PhB130]ROS77875.1 DNA-binding GntR family transcriptional regulator [Curtobacterium sp. PhB130]